MPSIKMLAKIRPGVDLLARAAFIRQEHAAGKAALAQAAWHWVNIGQALLDVKETIGHGRFMRWIEDDCGLKRSTAGRCMTFARRAPALKEQGYTSLKMTIREMHALVSKPRPRGEPHVPPAAFRSANVGASTVMVDHDWDGEITQLIQQLNSLKSCPADKLKARFTQLREALHEASEVLASHGRTLELDTTPRSGN